MLLRYPSPYPYTPQSFVYDGIYLEQNPTVERGKFIISKYSGKPPEPLRRPSHVGSRSASGRRVHLPGDSSDGISPARSPARNSSNGLETIFQDVSEGIQRRSESWGVAKAVRGAVTEAKKNMQTVHSEALPRMRYDNRPSLSAREASWTEESETVTDIRTRVGELEERNRLLAKSLSHALNDLRSHMMNMNAKKVDSNTTSAMKQALMRVQSVQTCLEDPSAPLQPTDSKEDKEPWKEENGQSPTGPGTTSKTDAPEKSSPSSSLSAKDQSSRLNIKPKQGCPTSMPLRRSPRPSLAHSEFSWMLGGSSNKSSFVSSASVPPEQVRHQNQALFGVAEEENSGSKRSPPEPDELAMSSLRGSKGPE